MRSSNQTAQNDHLLSEAEGIIDREVGRLLDELHGPAPLLHRMASYHTGVTDADGRDMPGADSRRIQGKRLRPLIAMLSCAATGGTMSAIGPIAAAIEMLHNFTLVHDDIQDRSPTRRHRPTVWTTWGEAQAINTGDAMFAAAQLGLLNGVSRGTHPETVVTLAQAFNRMTIDIVRGQVLDLEFEDRTSVTPVEYLEMIEGKTAAIVRFAAWAGAVVGGADERSATLLATFGHALGVGFQMRDDALGVWGTTEATGKAAADDIRRRKKSLPIILLRSIASDEDRSRLDHMMGSDPVSEENVTSILAMMERYGIAEEMDSRVAAYHDDAIGALDALPETTEAGPLAALRGLTDRMAQRAG